MYRIDNAIWAFFFSLSLSLQVLLEAKGYALTVLVYASRITGNNHAFVIQFQLRRNAEKQTQES